MEGWEKGHVVAERYRLEEPIGAGGMGMVWLAEHIQLRSPVAIKVMPERVGADEIRSERFIREARAAAAIRSTNVVQVLDYGVDDGVAYIAMEYLEGESLADRLDRKIRLSARETLMVITQVAKAIARAHKKGIIHRDLKPGNIFLATEDDGEVVKVLDFGIAKLTDKTKGTDQTTQTGYLLGTPNYMSPEQTRGHKVVDQRTDVWSLGIVAFECICGERPIDGETVGDIIYKICSEEMPKPSRVAPVPVGFDAWFRKATQRDPGKRFQTAKEMALALADAMDDVVPFSDPDSLDSLDRVSIELSDTLAAKRASEQAPPSIEALGTGDPREQLTIDSKNQSTIDSWDTDDGESSAPTTQVSGPPVDTGDRLVPGDGLVPGFDLEAEEPLVGEEDAEQSARVPAVTVGESLRGAGALTRTTESTAPSAQWRWLVGIGATVAIAAALFVVLGEQAPSPAAPTATSSETPATALSPAPSVSEESPPVRAPVPEPTLAPAASSATVPSPSPSESSSEAIPAPPKPATRPRPAAAPIPPSSGKPPAPGSGRIDFGI